MILPAFSKTYGDRTVLDFPGLELEPGRIYALIGANGSGKSTFAKILAQVEKPDPGSFRPLTEKLGYLPQKPYAFRMNVQKNLLLNGSDAARAGALLQAMELSRLAGKPAHRLSGGETARMALARLLMKRYDLLILDEPTAAMDMEGTFLAEKLIREYREQTRCAVILVTHSTAQARRLADRVLYFHQGRLLEQGVPQDLLDHPIREETRHFLDFFGG